MGSNEMDEDELVRKLRLVESGKKFYGDDKYKRAIQEFGEAVKLDPDDAKIYNFRGLAYFQDGQDSPAIADYKKALELDPGNSGFKKNLEVALKRKAKAGQIITQPVPGTAEERFTQLEVSLKTALRALAENKGICPRENIAGDRTKQNTYICFGTKRMDEKFPRDKSERGGHWNNGQQYYYFFHFENYNDDKMKGFFQFGPDRIGDLFDLHINLKRAFPYDEVLDEVQKTINAILRWEDRYLQRLEKHGMR
jgi:tetratricopeptide (TPR) repeat protein